MPNVRCSWVVFLAYFRSSHIFELSLIPLNPYFIQQLSTFLRPTSMPAPSNDHIIFSIISSSFICLLSILLRIFSVDLSAMQIPFILSTVFLLVQMTDAKSIPEKFFGRFVLEKSENFDEFLAAKGMNCALFSSLIF